MKGLLLAVFLVSSAGAVEVNPFLLRNRTPDAAYSVYRAREDGSFTRVGISTTTLASIRVPGAGAPPRPGLPVGRTWDWYQSGLFLQVDSPSGFLEPGNGVFLAGGSLMVCYKADGSLAHVIPSRGFVISGAGNNLTVTPDPDVFTLVGGVVTSKDVVIEVSPGSSGMSR